MGDGAQDFGDGAFSCEGGSPSNCFGRTGDQVLSSLGHIFPVEAEDTVTKDVMYTLAYGLAFKLLHIIALAMKTQIERRSTTRAPKSKGGTSSGTKNEVTV